MKKAIVLFKEGYEEIEALSVVDVFRRANIECIMVGMDTIDVTSSHHITVKMDQLYSDSLKDADAVILPGGLPGAEYLRDDPRVIDLLQSFNQQKKIIGAICAAPIVLQKAGLLKDKQYTCYPGMSSDIEDGVHHDKLVECDGHIITARGPGASLAFAYTLLEKLGIDSQSIQDAMQYTFLKNTLKTK